MMIFVRSVVIPCRPRKNSLVVISFTFLVFVLGSNIIKIVQSAGVPSSPHQTMKPLQVPAPIQINQINHQMINHHQLMMMLLLMMMMMMINNHRHHQHLATLVFLQLALKRVLSFVSMVLASFHGCQTLKYALAPFLQTLQIKTTIFNNNNNNSLGLLLLHQSLQKPFNVCMMFFLTFHSNLFGQISNALVLLKSPLIIFWKDDCLLHHHRLIKHHQLLLLPLPQRVGFQIHLQILQFWIEEHRLIKTLYICHQTNLHHQQNKESQI
mmetsp:Transcript_5803/g.8963  ORF Transcript_5803/g.8963 Transcript_5803/m.8963 type:complete len:267 (+) Transcript_5803:834-1634(+)